MINFPVASANGQIFQINDISWIWDEPKTRWNVLPNFLPLPLSIELGGTQSSTASGAKQELEILDNFATNTEVSNSFNNRLLMNPEITRNLLKKLIYAPGGAGTSTVVVSGGTATTTVYNSFQHNTSNSVGAGVTRFALTGSSNVIAPPFPFHPRYRLDFSRPISIQWSFSFSFSTQFSWLNLAVAQQRGNIFNIENGEVNDIGFGVTVFPNGTMRISARTSGEVVSNIVTLTNDLLLKGSTDIYQLSDGIGNLYTYVDDVLVSTLTGAPTELSSPSSSTFALWIATLRGTTTPPTANCSCCISYPKMFI